MTLFVQRLPCPRCHKPVYYDDETKMLECDCSKAKVGCINPPEFVRIKSRQEVADAKVLRSMFPEAPEWVNGKKVLEATHP